MGADQPADDPGVRALAWAQGRLLEALVGWWVDDGASSYEVYLDAPAGDTCSVRIWRRGGANFLRRAVIRLLTDKRGRPTGVTWNQSYSLDLDIAPIESVTWMAQKKAKPFVWHRWCDTKPHKKVKASDASCGRYNKSAEYDRWSQTWWEEEEEDVRRKPRRKEVNGTRTWWECEQEDSFDVMSLFEDAALKAEKRVPPRSSTASRPTKPAASRPSKPAAEVIKDMLQPDKPAESGAQDRAQRWPAIPTASEQHAASVAVAAAAAANHVAPANAVAQQPAPVQVQPPATGPNDYRRYYRCANPDCWFLVHPEPVFGGYCCRRCHWRHATGSKTTKLHGSCCTQQVAHQSLPRAPAEEPSQRSPLFGMAEDDGDGDKVGENVSTTSPQFDAGASTTAAAAKNLRPPGDWSAWSMSQAGVGRDAYGRPCIVAQQPYPFTYPAAAQYTPYPQAGAAAFAPALYNPVALVNYQGPAALPLSAPPELPAQELLC